MEKEIQRPARSKQWSAFDKRPLAEFEKSEKTYPVRFLYEPVEERYKLRMNRPYYPQLLNITQIAYFLNMKLSEVAETFRANSIFPAIHRKKSSMYTVKSAVDLARKLKKTFIIPNGFFNPPEHIFIGYSLTPLARIPHDARTKVFTSIFEMYMEEGIPVQNIYIAPEKLRCIEREFLSIAGKLYNAYNSAALKTGKKTKHIYLCTEPTAREKAEKMVEVFNKKFPGFLIAIDLDHLYDLRKRFAKNLKKQ